MTWLTKRKFWLRLLLVVLAFFILAISGLYLGRQSIVSSLIHKNLERQFQARNMTYSVGRIQLEGTHELIIENLVVKDSTGGEFVNLKDLHLQYRLWSLLRKRPFLESMGLQGLKVDMKYLSPKKETAPPPDGPKESLITKLQRLKRFLPKENRVKDVAIHYQDSIGNASLMIDSAQGSLQHFTAALMIQADTAPMQLTVNSTLQDRLHLELCTSGEESFPILFQRTGLSLQFDTLSISAEPQQLGFLNTRSKLALDFTGLRIKHPKLSADTIVFRSIGLNGAYSINPQKLELDSGELHFNGLNGSVAFQLPMPGSKGIYALHTILPWQAAGHYFDALPKGAFDDTRGIKADGELKYELSFILDESNPEDLIFQSKLEKKNFRILAYPGRKLNFFNDTFRHEVFEEGRLVRKLRIHPNAPNFTPIEKVSQDLINAILCSEDPSFFQHRGFILEAFRESILENYKSKSFKRGGSTISMQLVKNLFLNRNKTVFRKLEEALIVWLIEEQRLSSKERMMEVYLNIIEWGPGVYGVAEASEYYFQKKPADLSLKESIFLANIIPRPKKYYWAFEQDGTMKDYMAKLGTFIAKRMVKKEFLSPSDTTNFDPRLRLTGKSAERFQSEELEVETIDSTDFIPLSIPLD